MLTNIFCHSYNRQYSETDLGMFYPTESEKILKPQGVREKLSVTYKKIEEDLLKGLAAVNDSYYKQPKYRFNRRAAYAFASRYYLYTQQWEKVIEVSDEVLGSSPVRYVADWAAAAIAGSANLPNRRARKFASPDNESNFLILTPYSQIRNLGGWYTYDWTLRYNHFDNLAEGETFLAETPWGQFTVDGYQLPVASFIYPYGKYHQPIYPSEFQITDQVSQTGFVRGMFAAFTGEEVLLNRIEAYIHLERYDEALRDMNLLVKRFYKRPNDVTESAITSWFGSTPYATATVLSPKKQLHPDFDIVAGDRHEAYLQAILHLRRMVLLNRGLRWFDVKRYGIEVERLTLPGAGMPLVATGNKLVVRDPRRAIQIPATILSAGMEANPR